jgi:chromosome segregation ATPase
MSDKKDIQSIEMITKTTTPLASSSNRGRKFNNIDDKSYEILLEMKNKIGGYDVLINKLERLEENIKQYQTDMIEIKKSLYDHDEGLYIRLKNLDTQKSIDIKQLENKLESTNNYLNKNILEIENVIVDIKDLNGTLEKTKQEIELKLSEITIWKSNVDSILKWVIVTVASGVFGVIGKAIFDLISGG